MRGRGGWSDHRPHTGGGGAAPPDVPARPGERVDVIDRRQRRVQLGRAELPQVGVTADYVMGMTVVLADGQVLRLGGRTRKRSSGYRLAHLFIGSEGTLGIVTEVVLKLIPLPRHRATAIVSFRTANYAGSAVATIM